MTLTTTTLITYQTESIYLPNEWIVEVLGKVYDMLAAEKTNGIRYDEPSNTTMRHWSDRAAAEEWVNFILSSTQKYDIVVLNTQIIDSVV